jgi:hypothetical protein
MKKRQRFKSTNYFIQAHRAAEIEQARFDREWGDLSTYNAEVARGIEHTPLWKRLMQDKQARYNTEVPGVW